MSDEARELHRVIRASLRDMLRFLETAIAYFLAATRTRRTRLLDQVARDSRGLSPDALVTLLETARHRAKGRS